MCKPDWDLSILGAIIAAKGRCTSLILTWRWWTFTQSFILHYIFLIKLLNFVEICFNFDIKKVYFVILFWVLLILILIYNIDGNTYASTCRKGSHLSSRPWPTQIRPPCRGEGLLQDRWRTSNPIPQLLLHWPHEDQGVQPPFLRNRACEVPLLSSVFPTSAVFNHC